MAKKCKECGRPLSSIEEENGLCPSCKNKKDTSEKPWIAALCVALGAAVLAGTSWAIKTALGGKGGDNQA